MPATSSRRRVIVWDERATQAMRDLYVKFDRTVDDIAANKKLAADFSAQFARNTGISTTAEVIVHKLMNLRKKGSGKGGLPTIRH